MRILKTYRITVYPALSESYLVEAEDEEEAWDKYLDGEYLEENQEVGFEDWKESEIEELEDN